jgi:hypothetical protein
LDQQSWSYSIVDSLSNCRLCRCLSAHTCTGHCVRCPLITQEISWNKVKTPQCWFKFQYNILNIHGWAFLSGRGRTQSLLILHSPALLFTERRGRTQSKKLVRESRLEYYSSPSTTLKSTPDHKGGDEPSPIAAHMKEGANPVRHIGAPYLANIRISLFFSMVSNHMNTISINIDHVGHQQK